ncbi:hypothetical protein NSK_005497, partial [Nannochloropsis salina CCMP1776]
MEEAYAEKIRHQSFIQAEEDKLLKREPGPMAPYDPSFSPRPRLAQRTDEQGRGKQEGGRAEEQGSRLTEADRVPSPSYLGLKGRGIGRRGEVVELQEGWRAREEAEERLWRERRRHETERALWISERASLLPRREKRAGLEGGREGGREEGREELLEELEWLVGSARRALGLEGSEGGTEGGREGRREGGGEGREGGREEGREGGRKGRQARTG